MEFGLGFVQLQSDGTNCKAFLSKLTSGLILRIV
jgi:hypothetical protein